MTSQIDEKGIAYLKHCLSLLESGKGRVTKIGHSPSCTMIDLETERNYVINSDSWD